MSRRTPVGTNKVRRKQRILGWVAVSACVLAIAAAVGVLHERERIYRQVLLAEVAYQAAPPDLPPDQTALKLLEAVHKIESLPPSATIDDDPADTLIRGWGLCDSQAMAFVQLAEWRGLHGQLLFLFDQDGESPHSVAAIQLGGRWRIFDVLNGSVSRLPDGQLATAGDVASGRAPSTAEGVQASWYGKTEVFYETPKPVGLSGQVNQLELAALDVLARFAANQVQDLYLLFPPPTYVDEQGNVQEDWKEPGDLAYWRARNYDLFGRKSDAEAAYEQVLSHPANTHIEEAKHFLGQLEKSSLANGISR